MTSRAIGVVDSIVIENSATLHATDPVLRVVQQNIVRFNKATDSRGREIEGLWKRNGRFYCQLSIPGRGCRRVPLRDESNQPVRNVTEAIDAMHRLRMLKRQGEFPTFGRAMMVKDHIEHYLSFLETTGTKKLKTIAQERSILKRWGQHLGEIRLTQISRQIINDYVAHRKQSGVGNRAVNLDVLVLNNCLKHAQDEGRFAGKLPTESYKPLKYVAPKRPLFAKEQFEQLCQIATRKEADGMPKYRNGEQLADLIRFMRTSGARVTSALSARWSDVDWKRRQVHLRNTKYDKQNVVVDFNAELEVVLKDMNARRRPDSEYLFPSTREGRNVGSLRGTFEAVREEAGMPNLHFHDTRHHFISECVMSGVDFMTIARWVGHADGGMLIGKVYGHLSNEHAQRAASRVRFGNCSNESEMHTHTVRAPKSP